mmetsp:Transcript_8613/g.34114  ORF Transcript_8613/g.34114 Transcript_8613/m.34114 type:complete len:236 (-) Transcript_8613:106-813(-)
MRNKKNRSATAGSRTTRHNRTAIESCDACKSFADAILRDIFVPTTSSAATSPISCSFFAASAFSLTTGSCLNLVEIIAETSKKINHPENGARALALGPPTLMITPIVGAATNPQLTAPQSRCFPYDAPPASFSPTPRSRFHRFTIKHVALSPSDPTQHAALSANTTRHHIPGHAWFARASAKYASACATMHAKCTALCAFVASASAFQHGVKTAPTQCRVAPIHPTRDLLSPHDA